MSDSVNGRPLGSAEAATPQNRYFQVKGSTEHLRLIISARGPVVRRRIATVLARQGIQPSCQVEAPDAIADADTDPSSIIVFVCNVDLTREMAALRRLRRELREPAIVVISPPATGTGVRRALDGGADAIVFEPELESTLGVTVLAVASGQSVVPRKLRASVERPAFSHRERQVLALVSMGLTNGEIASQLLLAQSTVKSHLSSAFAKLGIRSRKEAAAVLLDPEQAQSVGLAGLGRTAADQNGIPQPIA